MLWPSNEEGAHTASRSRSRFQNSMTAVYRPATLALISYICESQRALVFLQRCLLFVENAVKCAMAGVFATPCDLKTCRGAQDHERSFQRLAKLRSMRSSRGGWAHKHCCWLMRADNTDGREAAGLCLHPKRLFAIGEGDTNLFTPAVRPSPSCLHASQRSSYDEGDCRWSTPRTRIARRASA